MRAPRRFTARPRMACWLMQFAALFAARAAQFAAQFAARAVCSPRQQAVRREGQTVILKLLCFGQDLALAAK